MLTKQLHLLTLYNTVNDTGCYLCHKNLYPCSHLLLIFFVIYISIFSFVKPIALLTLRLPLNSPVMMQLDILQHILCQNPSGKLHPFQLLPHLENQPEINRGLLFHTIFPLCCATFFVFLCICH